MMDGNELKNGLVKQTVAGEDACLGQGNGLAASGGDLATGLFDKETARGEIPGGKLVLEESAKASQANVRQVQCRGAHASHAVNIPPQEVAHGGQGRLHHGTPIIIVAKADEG